MPKYILLIAALLTMPVAEALAASDDMPETPKQCIADMEAKFVQDGNIPTFTMAFQNNCARAISCEINAYVVGSRGPTQGHKILKFEPKGQTPTTMQYALRVKELSGSAQYSRDCKFK
jgi:hypothetical protein